MDKFPAEILHSIFLQLLMRDKIACTLVCRHWYNVLSQRSLLAVVFLLGRPSFFRFKRMITRLPSQAAKVEELILYRCLSPNFDKRKLFDMFPNVRVLSISKSVCGDDNRQSYNLSRRFKFSHSNSKIVCLEESGNFELTRHLAASNLFNRLQMLSLRFSKDHKVYDNDIIFSQLVNMPVLEDLYFSGLKFEVKDLEIIHNNLPSVKKFDLDDVDLNWCEMPLDIKPATLIIDFFVFPATVSGLTAHIQLYQYMRMKYPNLTTLCLLDCPLNVAYPHSSYINQLFDRGILPLFQAIGPQLNHIMLDNLPFEGNVFPKLIEFGCRLESLSTIMNEDSAFDFIDLGKTEQSRSVKHLSIRGWITGAADILKKLRSLQTLEVKSWTFNEFPTREIDLCEILEAFHTTLLSLTLKDFVSMSNQSIPTCTTIIKKFSISTIDLTETLAEVISKCFPELERLSIKGQMSNNITISLAANHLKNVTISTTSYNQPVGFLIKTTDDGKSQYYAAPEGSGKFIEAVPVSSDEYNAPFTVTLICASILKSKLETMLC